jgi:GNAT superfamily N-acetyltransferase
MTSTSHRLRDGTTIWLRPLRRTDQNALVQAFSDLSAESRYNRFFSHLEVLSDRLVRYLVDVDLQDHFAWVAVEPGSGRFLGVGRWVRSAPGGSEAEVAIAVIDEYQSRGIGTALYERMRESALDHKITCFVAYVLYTNSRMRGLLAHAGASFQNMEHGVVPIRVELKRATDQPAISTTSRPTRPLCW